MGVGSCGQGAGSVSDQAVNAYLVDSGAVQQGRECVTAVMRGVIGSNPDSLQSVLKLFSICSSGGRLPINDKEGSAVFFKPFFHKAIYL